MNYYITLILILTTPAFGKRKNVLFIVSDDLRPELGSYLGPDFPSIIHPKIKTPHLDRLAKKSLLLKHAYVQQALCSPSRTSTLTGRRPDTTHVYDLYHYFRHVGGNFTTIPQYFKENGYLTAGMGKVFHPGHTSGGDDPISWTKPYFHGSDAHWDAKRGGKSHYAANDTEVFGKHPLVDMQTVAHAMETLANASTDAKSGERPFFVAVGIHRPHLPWTIPAGFLDLYPENEINLPKYPKLPSVFPRISFSGFDDLGSYSDVRPIYTNDMFNQTFPDDVVKNFRRFYYASVSYVDYLVGTLLDALDELELTDSTIVSFWGDHGYQLGEHGEWCKHNNFELSVHAPMFIKIPGLTDNGVVTERLSEFVDLFPTLVEAAELPSIPLCPEDSSNVQTCTEGVSLIPLISDPKQPWKNATFSQYMRMDIGCANIMGYSMRTERYRYTEWVPFLAAPEYTPQFGEHYAFGPYAELYDHSVDPMETINRFEDKAYKEIQKELAKLLHAGWRKALPPHYAKSMNVPEYHVKQLQVL